MVMGSEVKVTDRIFLKCILKRQNHTRRQLGVD